MSDPIEILMSEHRIIEKALTALERAATRNVPFGFYERAVTFLVDYADGCHHAKEEDRLFPMLEERGIPRAQGPIGVMCDEHVEGRRHIHNMREFIQAEDREGLRAESLEYTALLRAHIQKEDEILFPMGRNLLSEEDNALLMERFDQAMCACSGGVDYDAVAEGLLREAAGEAVPSSPAT